MIDEGSMRMIVKLLGHVTWATICVNRSIKWTWKTFGFTRNTRNVALFARRCSKLKF